MAELAASPGSHSAGSHSTGSHSFGPIARQYDGTRGGTERGNRVAACLAPHLDPARPVLDVGAGTGVVGLALRRRGHRVYGVDLSIEMLGAARHRLSHAVVADAARLPLRDRTFHQAYSVWVLQMVADQRAVLGELARILTPGGRYCVVAGVLAPADDDIGRVLDEVWRRVDPDGRRDDRPGRLARVSGEAGLRVRLTTRLPPTIHHQSPNQAADLLETRTPFCLWALTDDRWRAEIAPLVGRLRALPDPDRRRTRHTVREMTVLENPPPP